MLGHVAPRALHRVSLRNLYQGSTGPLMQFAEPRWCQQNEVAPEKLKQVIDRAGRDQQSAVRHQFTEYECRVEHQRSFGATAHEADRDRPARAVSDRELSALGSLDQ